MIYLFTIKRKENRYSKNKGQKMTEITINGLKTDRLTSCSQYITKKSSRESAT